ncbi:MAG TPA: 30S ribosomal protein S16 [Bacteroidales bacterium]|nr:30S ribosomal protein S16 [Bacteroidales bacterium]
MNFCLIFNKKGAKAVLFRKNAEICTSLIINLNHKLSVMPVRMRLQRHGKKNNPFYHIVVADGRAPRDGRFIEKIGTYNPMTNPAEINIDTDRAITWLGNGAQPTDTVRAILSYKGILYKRHLLKGVAKAALTPEQAEAKFQEWLAAKEAKIEAKKKSISDVKRTEKKKALESEARVREHKAAEVAKKRLAQMEGSAQEEPAAEE